MDSLEFLTVIVDLNPHRNKKENVSIDLMMTDNFVCSIALGLSILLLLKLSATRNTEIFLGSLMWDF